MDGLQTCLSSQGVVVVVQVAPVHLGLCGNTVDVLLDVGVAITVAVAG
jgi:hypothetical protein